jgi:transcriptional regulator NrdR family protein
MNTSKTCPACEKRTVYVRRSRPVKVGRIRVMVCGNCKHRWSSVEMTSDFIRDSVLRGDGEALRDLLRIVE